MLIRDFAMFERVKRGKWGGGPLCILLLTTTTAASAQNFDRPDRRVVGGAGGGLLIGLPTGELANNIDVSGGFGMSGFYNLLSNGALRVRIDGGFLQYGSETHEVCLANPIGCRVRVDVRTANSMAYGGVGPEVVLTSGFVRPYLNAGIGFSYFETASSLSGDDDSAEFAHTRHHDDVALAFTGGGGIYVPMNVKNTPLALDLSARYHRNGRMEYLREGDIRDNPDGTISFTPNRTDADFLTLQLGVSVGIRRK
jgi:opacity protein-like surface antigen